MEEQTYGEFVDLPLLEYQVLVFGSNLSGFHGAGMAGMATYGVFDNTLWKKQEYSQKSYGWKGKYNIKGQAEGLQKGTVGYSYALPTIIRPGMKRSVSLDDIRKNIEKLYAVAQNFSDRQFLIGYQDKGKNLNGYESIELAEQFFSNIQIPSNVLFSESFWKLRKHFTND